MRWLLFWQPPCLLRRVVVNFTHDPTEAIEGVLWSYRGGWMTLRDVSGIRAGHQPEAMQGEVVIERAKIAYFQVLPAQGLP